MKLLESILDCLPEEDRAARRVRPETRGKLGRGSHKPTYGTAAADWEDDGDPDLFSLSYGRQWNLHWRNDGGKFTEIGETTRFDGDDDESGVYPAEFHPDGRRAELPFRSNGNSFDATFADYDNDGDLDCVVSEYTHAWAGPSSDVTSVLTNTGKEGGYRFERRIRLDRKPFESRVPRRVALFRNDIANAAGHHFLSVSLEGGGKGGANRMGVGARVLVTTGDLTQMREVTAGRGHVGHQYDVRLVFGLGKAERVDRLEVRWNGAGSRVDVHEDIAADRFLLVREGRKPVDE
jgi:hypothetical protein